MYRRFKENWRFEISLRIPDISIILIPTICCVPCCYHYTCRQNSAYHRHKCSRTFLRYYSNFFHYTVFFLSLLCAVTLIILNLVLISSVHIIGWNTIPPEINRVGPCFFIVCISFLPSSQSIHAAILPSPLFSPQSLEKNVNDAFLLSDNKASTVCKPFWEDGELGLGFRRKQAGPWQTRRRFGDRLIVPTQVIANNTVPEDSHLKLRFDYAILTELGATHNRKFSCARGEQSEW
ncbi:unnamed protein product [Angiostrongylus costaricensis]|uniref:G_PROTEIN_RECEP_F1_2 domain-containing protein n=1 Tax=Angiostrongylus costaricensis TaxID=334426 RepID=A0A158PLG0_ANGCS|nr:unnamed protein product [Angiostrongylus costaricensis]